MMQTNIERQTLKKLERMTEAGQNLLTVLQKIQKLIGRGGQKIKEGRKPIKLLARQYEMAGFNLSHVSVAKKSKASLTTKITINH
jgi:hypothetical protein